MIDFLLIKSVIIRIAHQGQCRVGRRGWENGGGDISRGQINSTHGQIRREILYIRYGHMRGVAATRRLIIA